MADGTNVGRIVEIKGVVLDAVFDGKLPSIYNALHIPIPGVDRILVAEVQQHLGDDRVRAVAMDATEGLARGNEVIDSGAPISVPVGDVTLGRIFNVLGEAIDKGDAIPDARSGGRSTAHRRCSRTSSRSRPSSRPASRSSTCSRRTPAAARSACSAAPASARRC